ncbi:hypothetical protein HPB52_024654 [Rhipicephalus sanguineus]|uniref:Uncharacterized protein n=1 Tax=Rhipicephalus sanguineus TaxID=34632 RepID=A0A9D4TE31_RHISA|nr:hypothetical protein HPB52_005140 [Rhipicephalus sanguineus]KAH7986900.1 hypothetical protein HPB52_024654 [Rhipicephalus sanguineus]
MQGFVKLEKEYSRARPLNMPGIRLNLGQNIVDLWLSENFCQWIPTASLTYVVKPTCNNRARFEPNDDKDDDATEKFQEDEETLVRQRRQRKFILPVRLRGYVL